MTPRQTIPLRVTWIDTDASGRIHFTAVFRWIERAEGELMRSIGHMDEWAQFPRVHVEADYLQAMRFDDQLEVAIEPEGVGRTSITWRWWIWRESELCARGRATIVHVDPEGRPAPISDELRLALQ